MELVRPEQPVRFIVAFWNLLTYRTGGALPPPRPPRVSRPVEQVIEGELLMFEVDRRTGKVRFAAVRKERK
jgi:hypothetical protein